MTDISHPYTALHSDGRHMDTTVKAVKERKEKEQRNLSLQRLAVCKVLLVIDIKSTHCLCKACGLSSEPL